MLTGTENISKDGVKVIEMVSVLLLLMVKVLVEGNGDDDGESKVEVLVEVIAAKIIGLDSLIIAHTYKTPTHGILEYSLSQAGLRKEPI